MSTQTMNIWNTNGREPDSRDQWDLTGVGLRVGSVAVLTEHTKAPAGSTSIEYVATMGGGSTVKYASFEAFVAGVKGTIESQNATRTVVFLNNTDTATLGLFSLDMTVEMPDEGGDLSNFVVKRASPKVSKGTAQSTQVVKPLATDADLATVITKINEVISTLNTVRSTAGAGLIAANGVIDSLTTGEVMKA